MCTSPLVAYPSPSGGRPSFVRPPGHSGRILELPCGQCLHCRIGREREWSTRLMHEALFYPGLSWFVTNTFAPEFALPDASVSKETGALYLKRCRHAFGAIRYMQRAEYGERTHRAHYHYALFGPDLTDLRPARRNERGDQLYTSATLEKLWPYGFVEVAPLDAGSARYMSRYLVRSFKGEGLRPWDFVSPDGVITEREPPFISMSRRPGIGRRYVERYGHELGAGDFVVVDGRKSPTPGYYHRVLEDLAPALAERLAAQREAFVYSDKAKAERRPYRRAAKAKVLSARLSVGTRGSRRGL